MSNVEYARTKMLISGMISTNTSYSKTVMNSPFGSGIVNLIIPLWMFHAYKHYKTRVKENQQQIATCARKNLIEKKGMRGLRFTRFVPSGRW
jgi:hypothetical protein